MIAAAVLAAVMLVLHLLTPYWWWAMIVPFAYGLVVAPKAWRAAATGLASAGVLWFAAAAFALLTGSRIIASRMALMFGLSGGPWLMAAVTAAVAGIAGAVGALAGYSIKRLLFPPAKQRI